MVCEQSAPCIHGTWYRDSMCRECWDVLRFEALANGGEPCIRRRPPGTIQRDWLMAGRTIDRKTVPSQSGRQWLHDALNRDGSNRCIDSIPTRLQDIDCRK